MIENLRKKKLNWLNLGDGKVKNNNQFLTKIRYNNMQRRIFDQVKL